MSDTSVQVLQMAQRIRWVREIKEPDISVVAEVMHIPLAVWQGWESGLVRPDMDKLAEFAARFDVSLDFLWFGRWIGVDPGFRDALLHLHPELR